MKSIIQIVLFLAVVVGGVFGVTFLTQYTHSDSKTAAGPTPTPVPKALLKCREKTPEWDQVLSIPGYKSLEIEKGSKGHYDFLVSNVTDQPVKIVREPAANCTCTNLNVFFGIVPDADGAKLTALKSLPVGPQLEPYLAGVQWKPLDAEAASGPSAPRSLPGSPPAQPRYAVVRFDWEAVHEKMTTIKVNIVARQGAAADYLPFEVPITVRPPVLASTELLTMGDINPGEKKEELLVIWSPTRDHFDATAQLVTADPCILVSPPRPLTPEQLQALPAILLQNGGSTVCRTKCGYEIKVTAHERLGDNQLELGPFARRVIINRGTDAELSLTVAGTVRGPIEVGSKADRDRIDFRVFRSDLGAEKSVEIKSSVPGLALSIDRITPESIKAELTPSTSAFGGHSWKLTVVAPPDSQAGPLPADSAIYLKTNSTPPRRVRIPITGNASG
jgi:hypothetical protein